MRENTAIGLKMTKPWFDWTNGQVVVDSTPVSDAGVFETKSAPNQKKAAQPRVAFKLPSEKLFLISKLSDTEHLERFRSSSPKWINFYLVTPENIGNHMPTKDELYVSGKIVVGKKQQVDLQVGSETMPMKLGFRNATMNGFSIEEIKAGCTKVVLSGMLNTDNSILANSLVFEPVHQAAKTETRSTAIASPAKR